MSDLKILHTESGQQAVDYEYAKNIIEQQQRKIDELAATVERLREAGLSQREHLKGTIGTLRRQLNECESSQNLNAVKREGVLILARDLATTGEVDRGILECIEEYAHQRYPDKE